MLDRHGVLFRVFFYNDCQHYRHCKFIIFFSIIVKLLKLSDYRSNKLNNIKNYTTGERFEKIQTNQTITITGR